MKFVFLIILDRALDVRIVAIFRSSKHQAETERSFVASLFSARSNIRANRRGKGKENIIRRTMYRKRENVSSRSLRIRRRRRSGPKRVARTLFLYSVDQSITDQWRKIVFVFYTTANTPINFPREKK